MKVYTDFNALPLPSRPAAVALGMFDGVHLGHQKVIRQAMLHQDTCEPCVLTFLARKMRPDKKVSQRDILTPEERLSRLEQLGVSAVYMPEFSEIREMEAEDFIRKILHEKLRAKVLCCGDDFRFGKNARGSIALLKELGGSLGMTVEVVPPVMDSGAPISSTRIRHCLLNGEIPAANRLLGYRYYVEGKVVYGKQLGRTINSPTINQELSPDTCIPKFGVYISTTHLDGKEIPSITNIGIKPTIAGDRLPLAETHIIGIDRNLYGETLRVTLYQFIRDEMRFDSVEELSRFIQRDISASQAYFKKD